MPIQLVNSNTLASVGSQTTSFVGNGFTTDTCGGVPFPTHRGVPMQTVYTYNVIPAAFSTTCVVNSFLYQGNMPEGGINVTLNSVDTLSAATVGEPTTSVFTVPPYISRVIRFNNKSCIQLDCERNLYFIFSGVMATAPMITITGYDYRGVRVQEILETNTTYQFFTSTKPYSLIESINMSSNPQTRLSVGNFSAFGLPYYCPNASSILSMNWNGTYLNEDDFIPPVNWRFNNPSPSIGPFPVFQDEDTFSSARGMVVPVSSPNDLTGQDALVVQYFVYGADSEVNNNIGNYNQSDISQWWIQRNASDTAYALPYLTSYDLTGVQYPGDSAFIESYTDLLAS